LAIYEPPLEGGRPGREEEEEEAGRSDRQVARCGSRALYTMTGETERRSHKSSSNGDDGLQNDHRGQWTFNLLAIFRRPFCGAVT